jgi:hypothetical protein
MAPIIHLPEGVNLSGLATNLAALASEILAATQRLLG